MKCKKGIKNEKNYFLIFAFCIMPFAVPASQLSEQESQIINGINVDDASAFFAEVFQKIIRCEFCRKRHAGCAGIFGNIIAKG